MEMSTLIYRTTEVRVGGQNIVEVYDCKGYMKGETVWSS